MFEKFADFNKYIHEVDIEFLFVNKVNFNREVIGENETSGFV